MMPKKASILRVDPSLGASHSDVMSLSLKGKSYADRFPFPLFLGEGGVGETGGPCGDNFPPPELQSTVFRHTEGSTHATPKHWAISRNIRGTSFSHFEKLR